MLFANSTAILTDAFPAHRRGMALGINQIAAIAGSFLGLVLGGVLSEISWRSVFWVSVPIGIVGTLWSYHSLHELTRAPHGEGRLARQRHVRRGPVAPARGHHLRHPALRRPLHRLDQPLGARRPVGGVAAAGPVLRRRDQGREPMFRLGLFRNRAFALGNLAGLLSSMGRGGLQFMLIIWLQGIWLPLHGYSFESTPLWAGIYLLPLTVGFVAVRAGLRLALRPVRRPALRRHGPADRRRDLHRPAAPPGRLRLRAVRDPDVPERRRLGHVRRRRTPRRS